MEAIEYQPAGPVVEAFHRSSAFVRGLMGPVGSSKSSACCIEIFTRACEQAPHNGVRHSKWAAIRETYRELETTTLATWLMWFGGLAKTTYGSPIKSVIDLPLGDGTKVHLEVLFFPISMPSEVESLASLELTGVWMNEARQLLLAVLNKSTERVGRYPPIKWGGPTFRGVIMDTNSPDDDSWWYGLAEGADKHTVELMKQVERNLRNHGMLRDGQKLYEFFRQPGGLVESGGEYAPNPLAENISNLDGGYAYYFRQLVGKSREWIKAQILGQYASTFDGRPVYPEWNDEIHVRPLGAIEGLPLLLGFDYGLTPACVICQITPRGAFHVLAELCSKDMGIRQFAHDVVKPFLAMNYHGFSVQACGDPAGMARSDTDEKTCFQELAEAGIACVPASTNSFVGRREAVAGYLNRLVDGRPVFQLDPSCDRLRRGFNGRYQYRRLQVVGQDKFKDVPEKNDYSHPHDALQYAALYSQVMANSNEWSSKIAYPDKTGWV